VGQRAPITYNVPHRSRAGFHCLILLNALVHHLALYRNNIEVSIPNSGAVYPKIKNPGSSELCSRSISV
jgi:hypothetical protein